MATAAATNEAPKPKVSRTLLKSLEKALFDHALPGETEDLGKGAASAIVDFAAGLFDARTPGTPVIEIASSDGEPGRRRTWIGILNDDMPFLVDSVSAALTRSGITIHRLLHPILAVERDKAGKLKALAPARGEADGKLRESFIYVEADRVGARGRTALAEDLARVLAEVRVAVEDWREMLTRLGDARAELGRSSIPVPADDVMEAKAFLDWLGQDNFTLLGACDYEFGRALTDTKAEPKAGEGLGLLRDPAFPLWRGAEGFEVLPPALRAYMATPDPLLVTKANTVSSVHRNAFYDVVSVKRYNDKGKVIGERRFAGLFTSAALAASPKSIPIVRRKVERVEAALGFDPRSHTGKALAHIIDTFPREDLFLVDAERLTGMALGMLSLLERPRPKLFTRLDPFGRFVSVIVYVPRDAYHSGIRERVGAMLEDAFQARLSRYDVELRAEGLARVQYYLGTTPGQVPEVDEAALDARLTSLVRGWEEALEAALSERAGATRAARLALSHGRSFTASYREQFSADEAAEDVMRLTALETGDDRDVFIYRRPGDAENRLRIKIYRLGEIIPLSEVVPALENFGFRVIEEYPFDLAGGRLGWIHDFMVESGRGEAIDMAFVKERAEPALRSVLKGEQENDVFNALVVGAALPIGNVVWLRAYFRYMRQTGVSYSQQTVVDALRAHGAITAALVDLFRARFTPGVKGREAAMGEARARIDGGLADVSAIDEDRIISLYRDIISATLRTNAFVNGTGAGPEALAFKLDSHAVPGLPPPVPYREIWVYSPRVEGIHLRGGRIARGGLRWSDRRDDFRTEVLGLVKAQMVKNAVIVPTGSKGGFYPKQLPPASNREAWLAEGQEAYRIYIRALLSVTDNIVEGKDVPPAGIVCHDAPDPYLVVAADKGTATFSDIANAISVDHGFWLGDAFASGGANGYDHKAMGITAKGAWISVQRHFRERGVDVQKDAVRVIGVGDMSGDVFGNGMLLSKTLKVVAAFDHRHIFLDPEPDAAKSWKERDRLFKLPRSSWDDYDKKLISKGGGVFPRSQKSIALTPEVQAMLDVDAKSLSPSDLIHAILKSRADLCWFGGIGTYVKAATESNADVGDRANDPVRVNAEEMRVRVIGEGANLGVTQQGRIAFARAHGRINTDFIDNSAGVDCSDNEVNIKIALQPALASGKMSMAARNTLLESMTDDVGQLVLRDNVMQTQAISVAESGGSGALPAYQRVIQLLEASGRLDRVVENLPSDEQLTQRALAGGGLERPELAVLLAYAKMALYDTIVESPLPDDPLLVQDLEMAFPPAVLKAFKAGVTGHRLRREIIATKLANQIVNRGGITLAFELSEEQGTSLAHVASAFVMARELFDLRDLWRTIDAAAVDARTHIVLHAKSIRGLRAQMADALRASAPGDLPSACISAWKPGIQRLAKQLDKLLRPEPRAQVERLRQELLRDGAPAEITERLVELEGLDGAIGNARLASELGVPERAIADAYTRVGETLGLDWAKGVTAQLSPSDPWERLLVAGLLRDFEQLRIDLIKRQTKKGGDPVKAIEAWSAANPVLIQRMADATARARKSGVVTTAMLAHLGSQARALLVS
ncbi:NAD-glutamate dehydrogenase [Sphingosinicella xenopeptidilytica]|uniref:NAD-glutamate dehydrogenase n=1 Tax=Sphingosinicella xenopeptidilytica TaxID=364098 RepID=A0ABW3C724_SPHXN